jgi:maltooligosyltrehalose trehalohydrolase
VILAWGKPQVDAKTTRLEGHSFAVVKSTSTGMPPVDN